MEITLKQRTPVEPLPMRPLLCHTSRVVMLGSCFAESVGEELRKRLFDVTVNPFGTLYNPASIARSIGRMLSGYHYEASDLYHDGTLWHSMDHHSRFSAPTQEEALERINSALDAGHEAALAADVAVITLGTSWVFAETSTNQVVANCHKRPAADFTRRMLDARQEAGLLVWALREWLAVRPDLKVILTVSPVRHLADGAHGNSVSKASLLLACDETATRFDSGTVTYFPSYEIMIDDLRDYRYYASDMKHPSAEAVDYVYRVFAASFMDADTIAAAKTCERLTALASHRLLNASPEAEAAHSGRIRQLAAEIQPQSRFDVLGRLNSIQNTFLK